MSNEPVYDYDGQVAPGTGDEPKRVLVDYARPLDRMIGRLDRLLSEFLLHAEDPSLDEADRQTIKHHADDLIGVGNAALKKLQR